MSRYSTDYREDISWTVERIKQLQDEKINLKISEWAVEKRYMSKALTNFPGPWSNQLAPYTIEIMDCLCPDNPVREVAWMKAGQITATTAVLENWIGFTIDVDPAPMMYLTGSDELSKTSIEVKLDRMIASAGLGDKIRPSGLKTRKSGNTASRKDFRNGFLLAYGAQSTSKLKSVSVQKLAIDEVEEIPLFLRDQGDPIKLARVRQKGFDVKRKTLYLSTPKLTGGPIHKLFLLGDQRYYFVPCKHCGLMQMLEFRGKREDGKNYGVHYELDKDFILLPDSVEYRCKNCLAGWKNFDKYDFLNAGEWRPTARSKRRLYRSYQLDGLYSPDGMYSWESMVEDWLECWDPKTRRIVDVEGLRVFQNTGRGLPYEDRGQAPAFERVIQHRRGIYTRNQIPNTIIIRETESPVLLLTCAVDVHKRWLGVEIKGWCREQRSYSIDWRRLECSGDDDLTPAWDKLRQIIENEVWTADDGKKYGVSLTLIDARYDTSEVYDFCLDYSEGVYAIMGRDAPTKTARMSQFSAYTAKGMTAYNVNVTLYKDRVASWLRRDWNDGELQPRGYPNYPSDYGDDYFRQYEAEEKKQKINRQTGKRIGFVWQEKPNAPNHAWDCAIYNTAALDMLCYEVNLYWLKQDMINYPAFWDFISENKTYYYED